MLTPTRLCTNNASVANERASATHQPVVLLHLEKGSPWVYGALVNNIWSLTNNQQGGYYTAPI